MRLFFSGAGMAGCLFLAVVFGTAFGQSKLPTVILPAREGPATPMALMISGDGGWKELDRQLSAQFLEKGIPVVGLNALRYFWSRKTPQQATSAVEQLLHQYMTLWNKNRYILVGFSFGADVLPFIVNRMDTMLLNRDLLVVLLSPGPSTDFEIHISQMLSERRQWKYSVVQELQHMVDKKILFLFGEDEDDFPMNRLPKKNASVIMLKGGHHYKDNKADIARIILNQI